MLGGRPFMHIGQWLSLSCWRGRKGKGRARIRDGLRAFVGMTAFEELSRHWVIEQGRAGRLALPVQEVGIHRSRRSR